ncbi:helix-turn-helix domain-containing protein [Paenibacillus sp. L3-i20]|uniref:helix-turn-helix domain-containing protein n=1 Tax=Paenibacillus sp. L3-i20 TaxID=2905833 RepID=UPI0020808635|nr:putative HTH-type transcriptional regulator YbfP [Paenibacillus sp. L3-i20]
MKYHPMINQAIGYIETHLEEELTLEDVAAAAGFSMYHFHRIFQQQVGMSVIDYVRCRRLAGAAALLLHSTEDILQIAIQCKFESQEAFTRAFKKVYNLPPGRYRKLIMNLNGQMYKEVQTMSSKKQGIKGWILSGCNPADYVMGIDRENVHMGKVSGYLKSMTAVSADQFATMMQQFKADKFKGERIKLSAFIQSEDVEYFAGLWMRVDNSTGDTLQFDNMSDRPIVGTRAWNLYSIVLDVPAGSDLISFGVLLTGKGKVWMDGFTFEKVDKRTESTNMQMSSDLMDEPTNLSFEEE